MPVQELPHSHLMGEKNSRHFASEPHLRIQVIPIPVGHASESLFDFHGELLLICLYGKVVVRTTESRFPLVEYDQLLLIDGEKFSVENCTETEAKVQFIWAPGLNSCTHCASNR